MSEGRLIDANALPVQTAFEDEEGRPYQFVQALDIDAAPTIDPVRHARWEAVNEHCNHAAVFRCSGRDGCGASVDYGHYTRFCDYDWCPNCGARMDEEEEKDE
jgi:hypothetical protein